MFKNSEEKLFNFNLIHALLSLNFDLAITFVGAFFCGDTVDGIGKEVRPRLTLGLCGGPRGYWLRSKDDGPIS